MNILLGRLRAPRQLHRRRGLTLTELVVVLTILVALGGLIVPMLPNFLAKTHFAKCSTTIPELNKLWITSFTSDVKYPDGYDSLQSAPGTLFTGLPGVDAGGEVVAGTITAEQADALRAIGVTRVYDHTVPNPGNATLDSVPNDPTGNTLGRLLTADQNVALLNPAGPSVVSLGIDVAKYTNNGAIDTDFVVLGVGNNCSACGPRGLMVEAPTHFGGENDMNPVDFYQRYCVVFAVSNEGADSAAEFVCACSIHPDGFDGAEAHIRAYYEDQQD